MEYKTKINWIRAIAIKNPNDPFVKAYLEDAARNLEPNNLLTELKFVDRIHDEYMYVVREKEDGPITRPKP